MAAKVPRGEGEGPGPAFAASLGGGDTMSSRRHNLPVATTRSRGLPAAGGGSVAAIASATVSSSAAHAVMTAMANLRNI